jgi:catechol 2,3-dioxygenase-like lactoylglutathione lyase family enzyme
MLATSTRKSSKKPLLDIKFLSHGTLEVADLQRSRRFYEEVLGFDVIQNSPVSMMLRKGGDHVYVAVCTPKPQGMGLMNHNGLDVGSMEEVDKAHQLLESVKDEYGIRKIQRPHKQHGAYAFYFEDLDGNWWEILYNPPRGYSVLFDQPEADFTGLSAEEFAARAKNGH